MKALEPRAAAFARAAAVLWEFTPETLQPDDTKAAAPHEASQLLAALVVPLRSRGATVWTLRDEPRREILRDLDRRELLRIRNRNVIHGNEQEIVDRWLAGGDPAFDHYSLEQLAVLERIRDWFAPQLYPFPSSDEISRLRGQARLRAPLQRLVGPHFCGRRHELAQVAAFVSNDGGPGALVVHGIGGIGKSALVAKFLLDKLAARDPTHVVGYLDFDDPKLDISDGVSLVLEIARQMLAQSPSPELALLVQRAEQTTTDLAVGGPKASGRAIALKASTDELAFALGDLARRQGIHRFAIVFDTFEEMQYANTNHLTFLLEQLAVFGNRLPTIRPIIVSRARLEIANSQFLSVEALDDDACRAYLAARGITDATQVAEVLEVAKGNPLSLFLAANVLLKQGNTGLEASGDFEQELVQGQLYTRILRHIHVADVQRLAHPGLVLRRITPELIREVLAQPCGLGDVDDKRAEDLFDGLAREISLVRRAADGALEHRADVRRVMVRLLYRDQPHLAYAIHERAAAYYAARFDETSIVEEAYHRFALGETHGPWLDRLGQRAERLRGALEELPETTWPTLASYGGIDLPQEMWQAANEINAERRLAARLEELVSSDRHEDAARLSDDELSRMLDDLQPRPGEQRRRGSLLWRWQGRALANVGRYREAITALERSLATLVGPADELERDRQVAISCAEALGDEEALARLRRMGRDVADVVHVQDSLEVRIVGVDAIVEPEIRWLDDREIRALVRRIVTADDIAPESLGTEFDSTRSATLYSRVVKLNGVPVKAGGASKLVDWANKVQGTSFGSLSALKKSLK